MRTGATAFRSAASRRSIRTQGGVVSAGGVGFDISCGVRCLHTGLDARRHHAGAEGARRRCSITAFPPASAAPARSISTPRRWTPCSPAARAGRSSAAGARRRTSSASRSTARCKHAKPGNVSEQAKKRQRDEMGTLGSGNHYLEVQEVTAVFDADDRRGLRPRAGRHRGHDPLRLARPRPSDRHRVSEAHGDRAPRQYGITLPDRELACAPINSDVGQEYLGAMRAAINCALANRQILTHLVRAGVRRHPAAGASCRCSTTSRTTPARSRSTASTATLRRLYVHRKGATRAFGPGHPDVPEPLRARRPAGADRRLDGHRLLRARGHAANPKRSRSARPATAPAAR